MHRYVKTAGAVALTAMMLGSFAACGPGFDPNADLTIGDDGKYVPPAEWHEELDEPITMFDNDWEYFNNGAAVRSPVYRELKKACGADLKAISSAFDGYYNRLDIMRTTQTLPDMFRIDGPVGPELYRGLIRDGEIIPISYYVNEENYPNLYNYLKQFDYMKKNVTYAHNELWCAPVEWTADKSLYVRRDWLKNLNNKIDTILVAEGIVSSTNEITDELRTQYRFSEEGPADLGEFYRLARAFTKYDPDGNGRDDTYGYVTEENRDFDSWISVAFDTPWKMWVDDGTGHYVNTVTLDGSMYATSLLTQMIKEGYASREVGTKSTTAKQADFETGKAGMMLAHNWYNLIVADMMHADTSLSIEAATEKILACEPPMGKNGNRGTQGNVQYYTAWCIKEGLSVERREACLKLLDYVHSQEGLELLCYGVYGEHWEWKDDIEGGERVTLCEGDGDGMVQQLRWTDYAAFASYLSFNVATGAPAECYELQTNGPILVQLMEDAKKNMYVADYPDLYTDSMMQFESGAYDHFKTEVLKMIINGDLAPTWTYNAATWKDDWKTALYTVSDAMQSAWDAFVSDYNGNFHGAQMEADYNEAVATGEYYKVNA